MTLKEKKELLDSMNKDTMIYCDMDGVLAKWIPNCTYEMTWQPNYFYDLELEYAVREALIMLHDAGFNVCVLSAAYMNGVAEVDKARWLDKFGMSHLKRLFVPCGQNKADFIEAKKDGHYVLLDDYNFNLTHWDQTHKNGANFTAVKFLNGINGGGDIWKGRVVYHKCDGETIANMLAETLILG